MAMFILGLMVMLDEMKSVMPGGKGRRETGPASETVGNRQNLDAALSGRDESEDALTVDL